MNELEKYEAVHKHIVRMIEIYESKLDTFPPFSNLAEDIEYQTLMMSIRSLYIADELIMAKIWENEGE